MTWPRVLTGALLFGFTTVWTASVLAGGHLTPDTASFAAGRSAWSSPLLSVAGRIGGLTAVRLVAISGLLALSLTLWRSRSGVRTLAVASVLALGPWSNALGCAGADAAGTVAFLALARRSRALGVFAAPVHLASGLSGLAGWLGSRVTGAPFPLAVLAAALLEVVVLRTHVFGLTHSHEPTQVQWRYLLPALVALLPERSEASTEPQASSSEAASFPRSTTPHLPAPAHLGATRAGFARGGERVPLLGLSAGTFTDAVHASSDAPLTLSLEGNGRACDATAATPTTRIEVASGHRKE